MRGGCFSVRLAILIAVGTIALIVYGGFGVYEGIRFRQPIEITYDQFLQQKPKEGWFRITGGILFVLGAGSIHDEKKQVDLNDVHRLYVPMYTKEDLKQEQEPNIHLFVSTTSPDVLNAYKSIPDQSKG